MGKHVVFVPGYQQTGEDYPRTMEGLAARGHTVYPVKLDWSDEATPQQWGAQVSEQVADFGVPGGATLVGHSFGALAAAGEAANHPERYDNLLLCSLTPVGREDLIDDLEARDYYEGNTPAARYESFAVFSLDSLLQRAQRIPKKLVLVGGQEAKEHTFMRRRAQKAARILGTSAVTIAGAPHFMDYDNNYVQTVIEQI